MGAMTYLDEVASSHVRPRGGASPSRTAYGAHRRDEGTLAKLSDAWRYIAGHSRRGCVRSHAPGIYLHDGLAAA